MFTKESLEKLREKIDLFEVISAHVALKRAGTSYKALCPFHQEKTPSFTLQKGDSHYHCFGCGAHGDAIQFLMHFSHLSFKDAVFSLGERFGVTLEEVEKKEEVIDKAPIKEALEKASLFFQAYLLYSEEGKEVLTYLFKRGLTLDFIRRFQVGLAPESAPLFFKAMESEKISHEALLDAGLLSEKRRPFFRERITFPIHNQFGHVVGFSARKYKESTFGGKYINTPETALFKKSRILFGLPFSRRRIAKEKRAIIVEGQIDCLKLIESGLNVAVAALGTAFGESHVSELEKLGVRCVFLLFDGDEAGKLASSKVGDLFQKKGIDVKVIRLPSGMDPDLYLNQLGVEKLIELLDQGEEYLRFQIQWLSKEIDIESASGKAEIVKKMKKQIEEWGEPVMVHESLKKLASYLNLPDETVGVQASPLYVPQKKAPVFTSIDPNRILELDLLRWLILLGKEKKEFVTTASFYLNEHHFWTENLKNLFKNFLSSTEKDLLSICGDVEDPLLMDEILQKRVNLERADEQFLETVQKLLDRQWMQTREEIKMQIHMGNKSDEAVLELARKFDELKKNRPQVQWIRSNT